MSDNQMERRHADYQRRLADAIAAIHADTITRPTAEIVWDAMADKATAEGGFHRDQMIAILRTIGGLP